MWLYWLKNMNIVCHWELALAQFYKIIAIVIAIFIAVFELCIKPVGKCHCHECKQIGHSLELYPWECVACALCYFVFYSYNYWPPPTTVRKMKITMQMKWEKLYIYWAEILGLKYTLNIFTLGYWNIVTQDVNGYLYKVFIIYCFVL